MDIWREVENLPLYVAVKAADALVEAGSSIRNPGVKGPKQDLTSREPAERNSVVWTFNFRVPVDPILSVLNHALDLRPAMSVSGKAN